MKMALFYMTLGAAFLMGTEYYMLKKDDINKTMKKLAKNPDKALSWLKSNMLALKLPFW